MTDRALSEEALIASLRDIRLPADAPGGPIADVLAAAALALLAALVVGIIIRGLSELRTAPAKRTLAQQLADLDGLPEPDQRVRLLHLLKTHAPQRFETVKQSLYRPDTPIDLAALKAELADA